MTTIMEDYVSFETAKLLKEKEFDWNCITYYVDYEPNDVKYSMLIENNTTWEERCCSAPTLQMAMKWLREIHHIIFVFKPSCFNGDECTYWTYELWCGDNFEGEILSFKTYEQAVEAALKHVLENLI